METREFIQNAIDVRGRKQRVATLHSGGIMRKSFLVMLMVLAVAAFAAAQIQAPTSDVLGAHLNYGRGCAACHAPHSGAYGNGAAKTADANSGNLALWGQDTGSLYGKTIVTGQLLPEGGG